MKSNAHNNQRFNLVSAIARYGGRLKKIPYLPILIDEQVKIFTFFFRPRRFMGMRAIFNHAANHLHLETAYHRFGGIDFRWNKREIAHLHSNGLLDVQYPRELAELLISYGLTERHHVYPASGWTTFEVNGDSRPDVAIQLISWSLLLHKKEITLEEAIELVKNNSSICKIKKL
jgi:hypothetical protein